jgi:hypothetical protein
MEHQKHKLCVNLILSIFGSVVFHKNQRERLMFSEVIRRGLAMMAVASPLFASNPIITVRRAADPSPKVFNGTVFLYCSHDQDTATSYTSMDDYYVYSSTDMVHWQDRGMVLNSSQLINQWAGVAGLWAPDCAFKNGIYYFYFPATNEGWGTGVAVSRVPQGPFKDTLGKAFMAKGIDPMCFIDDDGQAYLYQGGTTGGDWVAKLNPDMISLAEAPRQLDIGTTISMEGPYMHKRNGIYYFSGSHGNGYYCMGTSPYGPFTYKGVLANKPSPAQDHHAIIQYKGTWYYFYHVGNYTDSKGIAGTSHRRNVAVEYLYYNADGTIKPIEYTTAGVKAVDSTSTTALSGHDNAESEVLKSMVYFGKLPDLSRLAGNAIKVDVYSLQGKKILSFPLNGNSNTLSLPEVGSNAVYYLKFTK